MPFRPPTVGEYPGLPGGFPGRQPHEREPDPSAAASTRRDRAGRALLDEGLEGPAPPAQQGRSPRRPEGAAPQAPGPPRRHRRAPVSDARDRVGGVLEIPAALDLDPRGACRGLDRFQLHRPPPRRAPSRRPQPPPPERRPDPLAPLCDPLRDLGLAVHALAPDAPRRARRRRGRPQAALPLAQDREALVQAALLHARALPDLLPRGPQRDRELSRARPAQDRVGAPRDDPLPRRRHGCPLLFRRLRRARPCLSGPGIPGVPDRVRLEPPRAALRDRPVGPGQVGLDPEALALLGLLVPLFGLPSRAPLLHGRSDVQPAPPALRPPAVLRGDRLEADNVRAALPGLDLREQDAAHRLAPRGLTRPRWKSTRPRTSTSSSASSTKASPPPRPRPSGAPIRFVSTAGWRS